MGLCPLTLYSLSSSHLVLNKITFAEWIEILDKNNKYCVDCSSTEFSQWFFSLLCYDFWNNPSSILLLHPRPQSSSSPAMLHSLPPSLPCSTVSLQSCHVVQLVSIWVKIQPLSIPTMLQSFPPDLPCCTVRWWSLVCHISLSTFLQKLSGAFLSTFSLEVIVVTCPWFVSTESSGILGLLESEQKGYLSTTDSTAIASCLFNHLITVALTLFGSCMVSTSLSETAQGAWWSSGTACGSVNWNKPWKMIWPLRSKQKIYLQFNNSLMDVF